MFPFWKSVMEPIVRASGARRVVEIGALQGENTVQMLDALPADAELHVIDPVPQFDPEEHAARFGGRYVFHEDLSHNVLPGLDPMDVAIIDGDHNWYTVYHELQMLAKVARAHDSPLPIMLMHDVAWPYGHRDLYYAPEQIPEEYRQPYRRAGMRIGQSELVRRGGLNHQMANAEHEGGERNGVMQALEDFLDEYDRPVRHILIPIYFGLSIVVEEATIDANAELASVLEQIESADGLRTLLELGESIRLSAMVWNHSVEEYRGRLYDHATARLLDVVKSALVNEHYLEHEIRLSYLMTAVEKGQSLDRWVLRDPYRARRGPADKLRTARMGGAAITPESNPAGFWPYAPSGKRRLDRLHHVLDAVRDTSVGGDFVDCHVGRGGAAIMLSAYRDAYQMNDRHIWVVDEFGVDAGSTDDPYPSDLNLVREGFDRFGLLDDRVRFAQGPLPDAVADSELDAISVLRIGGNNLERVRAALDTLYGRVAAGGFVIVDTTSDEVTDATQEWLRSGGSADVIERLDETGAVWTKTEEVGHTVSEPTRPLRRPMLAPELPDDPLDLSVIVTFYDMSREAKRTLHSLSRSYQQDLADVVYEVLVIDNGSSPGEEITAEFVRSFGDEFRLLDAGRDVSPSPTTALNHGLRQSRGRALALMIDGAHLLTPKVLSLGLTGLRLHDPAVVLTQAWYMGPGQQHDVMAKGYDQDLEDRLFEEIAWPTDGYRLFEVGSFIGERDWFDGIGESNCIFIPRGVLRQVGAFDDSFSIPGGSFANLDLYERVGSTPGLTVVSLLGEASFHQLHDGTTTNEVDQHARGRMLNEYRRDYDRIRGRPFTGPGKRIHYLGSIHGPSKRTRARRLLPTSPATARAGGPDGRPEKAIPISDELKTQFVDSVWNSLEWNDPTWLGKPTRKSATDLMSYQEIIVEQRPDAIIDIGTGGGGRALFMASVCELIEHGRVISIGRPSEARLPAHDRVTWIRGEITGRDEVGMVRDLVGDGTAMVVCSMNGARKLLEMFETYSPFVAIEGYFVFEDTIVNGNPVWANFGQGPNEAVKSVIRSTADFYVDPSYERFATTFNIGGYLKRHRSSSEDTSS